MTSREAREEHSVHWISSVQSIFIIREYNPKWVCRILKDRSGSFVLHNVAISSHKCYQCGCFYDIICIRSVWFKVKRLSFNIQPWAWWKTRAGGDCPRGGRRRLPGGRQRRIPWPQRFFLTRGMELWRWRQRNIQRYFCVRIIPNGKSWRESRECDRSASKGFHVFWCLSYWRHQFANHHQHNFKNNIIFLTYIATPDLLIIRAISLLSLIQNYSWWYLSGKEI